MGWGDDGWNLALVDVRVMVTVVVVVVVGVVFRPVTERARRRIQAGDSESRQSPSLVC